MPSAHSGAGKERGLTNKLMTEQQAVSRFVADGDYIGLRSHLLHPRPQCADP